MPTNQRMGARASSANAAGAAVRGGAAIAKLGLAAGAAHVIAAASLLDGGVAGGTIGDGQKEHFSDGVGALLSAGPGEGEETSEVVLSAGAAVVPGHVVVGARGEAARDAGEDGPGGGVVELARLAAGRKTPLEAVRGGQQHAHVEALEAAQGRPAFRRVRERPHDVAVLHPVVAPRVRADDVPPGRLVD